MNAYIRAIEYALPETFVTNDDLQQENPDWNIALTQEKTGVFKRHVAREDETALDLAVSACSKLLLANEGLSDAIDGLIFCTHSPDYIMPGNCFLLQKELNLGENILAYDFVLACSGFVYGLAMAQGFIQSGLLSNILLVTSDTLCKYIHPRDRSTRLLFGDGASATWLTGNADYGLVAISCASHGADYRGVMIEAGGCRVPISPETKREFIDNNGNVHTLGHMIMDGTSAVAFARTKVPALVREFMRKHGFSFDNVDLVIIHQGSRVVMDIIMQELSIPADKCFFNIRDVGNLSSSSIPVALKAAIEVNRITPGVKAMLIGFGAGLSSAVAVVQF